MTFKLIAAAVLVIGSALADSAERPPCNARNRGAIWPERITSNSTVPILVCTASTFKYRWEPATVRFSELGKQSERGKARENGPKTTQQTARSTETAR